LIGSTCGAYRGRLLLLRCARLTVRVLTLLLIFIFIPPLLLLLIGVGPPLLLLLIGVGPPLLLLMIGGGLVLVPPLLLLLVIALFLGHGRYCRPRYRPAS
jgi:hypothetical protein